MGTNVKRNMVQVRLTDSQYNDFELLRKQLSAQNNAEALRKLIDDRKNIGTAGQTAIKQHQQTYDDLEAKLAGLMWDSSNITKNMNQIAHAVNIAKKTDPSNTQTWNWVVNAIQTEYKPIVKLSNLVDDTKKFIKESREHYASCSK